MTGNQKAQFYLYNLKINDNRVIVKVNLQAVELFKEKGQRLGCYKKNTCSRRPHMRQPRKYENGFGLRVDLHV